MENKVTSHVTKGLIIATVLVLLDVVSQVWNFKSAAWFKWVPSLVMMGGVIWACMSYGAQHDHRISFGDLFAHGFKTTAVIVCIFLLYMLLSILVLFPGTKEIVLGQTRKEMERMGTPDESIERNLAVVRNHFIAFTLGGAMFLMVLTGALFSVVGAAITRKRPTATPF